MFPDGRRLARVLATRQATRCAFAARRRPAPSASGPAACRLLPPARWLLPAAGCVSRLLRRALRARWLQARGGLASGCRRPRVTARAASAPASAGGGGVCLSAANMSGVGRNLKRSVGDAQDVGFAGNLERSR